jgi:hypothetical protein
MNLDMVSCGVPGNLDGAVEEYGQNSNSTIWKNLLPGERGAIVRLRIRKPLFNRKHEYEASDPFISE